MGMVETVDAVRAADAGRRSRRWYLLAVLPLWAISLAVLLALVHPAGDVSSEAGQGAHAHTTPGDVSPWVVLGSWAAMVGVMMLPTAVPMLRALGDLLGARGAGDGQRRLDIRWWAFLAGYFAVWSVWSLGAGGAQLVLARAGGIEAGSLPPAWAAATLAGAGLYQFSRWKLRCLTGCLRPITFLLARWRDGVVGAWRMGARHGADCVGCCWALMGLAFVGGLHSWWFMGLMTVLMVVEKLPRVDGVTRRPFGAALIVAAAATLLQG